MKITGNPDTSIANVRYWSKNLLNENTRHRMGNRDISRTDREAPQKNTFHRMPRKLFAKDALLEQKLGYDAAVNGPDN